MAAETARQQVQDQALVDHEHWLRQQRIEAYTAFLAGYDECTKISHRTRLKILDMSPGTGLPEDDFEEMTASANALRRLRQRVKLVGPAPIHSRAVELEEAVWSYHSSLEVLAEAFDGADETVQAITEEHEEMRGTATAHDAFVRAVGSLLEGVGALQSDVGSA
ncbi:hypothetical protein [Streptomyces collinus]|uniref:hypothetical protein n=1 Tax=Streptomyces collinus TaxID=42684 RepID=UPI0036ED5815